MPEKIRRNGHNYEKHSILLTEQQCDEMRARGLKISPTVRSFVKMGLEKMRKYDEHRVRKEKLENG